MFPYTMLATTTIFYSNDWPKRLSVALGISHEPRDNKSGKFVISKLSSHCIYEKDKDEDKDEKPTINKSKSRKTFYHKFFTLFTLIYLAEQLFLPYSHFITKVKPN